MILHNQSLLYVLYCIQTFDLLDRLELFVRHYEIMCFCFYWPHSVESTSSHDLLIAASKGPLCILLLLKCSVIFLWSLAVRKARREDIGFEKSRGGREVAS